MNIAFSNLAWDPANDPKVREVLLKNKISFIELAPTKIWSDPAKPSDQEITTYRKFWNSAGIQIVALQSLLFGLSQARIFDPNGKKLILERLEIMARLAATLDARVLVFGSPKQRQRGTLSLGDAQARARDFFHQAAEICQLQGVVLALEPNPREYGCDFILNSSEAIELIEAVDHSHFRLHVDSACAALAGEDPAVILQKTPKTAHVHLSAFQLTVPDAALAITYANMLKAGAQAGYKGFYSFEYLAPPTSEQQLTAIETCRALIDSD
jgi:sugar phosphate isomerase/epimerase